MREGAFNSPAARERIVPRGAGQAAAGVGAEPPEASQCRQPGVRVALGRPMEARPWLQPNQGKSCQGSV